MKQSFVVIICLISSTGRAEPQIDFALKGGADAANLTKDYRINRYGFSGGVAGTLRWLLVDRFSLAGQVEALYTPRGAEVVIDGVLQGKFRQHYLDIVIATRPEMRISRMSAYLLLGGELNLLTSANSEITSGMPQDITDGLRRIDIALLVGAGFSFHITYQKPGLFYLDSLFLEVRHDHGLIGIDPMDDSVKNRTSSLMVGLSLMLKSGEPSSR